MKLKRNISIFLVLVMIVALFSGLTACSKADEPSETTEKQTTTTTAATTKAADETTKAADETTKAVEITTQVKPERTYEIKLATIGDIIPVGTKIQAMVEARLFELGLSCTLEFQQIGIDSATYAQNLSLLLAAQDLPDIFQSDGSIDINAVRGSAAPIEVDEFKTYMPNMWIHAAELAGGEDQLINILLSKYSIAGDPLNPSGTTYIMRVPFSNTDYAIPVQTGINVAAMEDVGVTKIPESVDEMEALYAKYKEKYPNQYPLNVPAKNFMWACFNEFTGAYGIAFLVPWYLQNGQLVNIWNTPNMKLLTAKLHDFYVKGYINPEFVTTDYVMLNAQFEQGIELTNSLFAGDWWVLNPNNPEGTEAKFKLNNPDAKIGVLPFLKSEMYPDVEPSGYGWLPFTGSGVYINKETKKNDIDLFNACLTYLDLINYDKEVFLLSTYGIEGLHWNKDGDGIVVPSPDYSGVAENLNKARLEGFGNYRYKQGAGIGMGVEKEWIRTKIFKEQLELNKELLGWDSSTYLTKFLYNIVDTTLTNPAGEQILEVELNKKLNDWYQFIMGTKTMDEWDSWLKELGELKLDEMTEAANRLQLQHFKDFYGE